MPRRIRRIALACALSAAAFLAWLLWAPLATPTLHFNGGENAIWLGHRWFGGDAQGLDTLAARLRARGIRDLYVHCGPLRADGSVPDWSRPQWQATLAALRREVPGARVHGWLGGLTTVWHGKAADTIDLADPRVRERVAQTGGRLVAEAGFDGIHYDLEPLRDSEVGWLDLLRSTRAALGDRRLGCDAPNLRPGPFTGGYGWTPSYLRQVAECCDQIAVMSYDTAMPTPRLYSRYVAWEASRACEALAGTHCRLILGVPTYPDRTWTHMPSAENMESALLGIRVGVERAGNRSCFQGIGIYAEWTTTVAQWGEIERGWRAP